MKREKDQTKAKRKRKSAVETNGTLIGKLVFSFLFFLFFLKKNIEEMLKKFSDFSLPIKIHDDGECWR